MYLKSWIRRSRPTNKEIKAYEAWRDEEEAQIPADAYDYDGDDVYGMTMEEAPDLEGYKVIDYDD